jgi:predicted nuclease of predicted toxin-antitoxin system
LRFLIDECLHTSLVSVAEELGHEAQHVNWRGMSGTQDHNLVPVAVDESLTFVTNNARDFRRLFAVQEAHAGLVVILPFVEPGQQRELFAAVLEQLGVEGELFNEEIEVTFEEEEVVINRWSLALEE